MPMVALAGLIIVAHDADTSPAAIQPVFQHAAVPRSAEAAPSTNPCSTGEPPVAKTIGIVEVAFMQAAIPAEV